MKTFKQLREANSYSKPDEHTGVMSYHDLEAHIGKPKALLIAKHEQFKRHMSPQMSLGAKVGFKFERRHGLNMFMLFMVLISTLTRKSLAIEPCFNFI